MSVRYLRFFLAAAFLFGLLYWQLYVPTGPNATRVFLEVKSGESFATIVSILREKKLIRNPTLFKLFARAYGLDREVKVGSIQFDTPVVPIKVLRSLTTPRNAEISLTIPEGFSIFQIDEKLTSLGVIQPGDFKRWAERAGNYLEGYLFPDTYFIFAHKFKPEDLGNDMLRTFEIKVVRQLHGEFAKSSRNFANIITMASILEKEVRVKEDMPVVAGILWKRFDHGWPLQADATVLYGKEDRSISLSKLQEDSPYNTYTRQGFPQTPIGNPGLLTLRAALNPIETPYWYYLTGSDGKAIYAKTNEEHNRNKKKYLLK